MHFKFQKQPKISKSWVAFGSKWFKIQDVPKSLGPILVHPATPEAHSKRKKSSGKSNSDANACRWMPPMFALDAVPSESVGGGRKGSVMPVESSPAANTMRPSTHRQSGSALTASGEGPHANQTRWTTSIVLPPAPEIAVTVVVSVSVCVTVSSSLAAAASQ